METFKQKFSASCRAINNISDQTNLLALNASIEANAELVKWEKGFHCSEELDNFQHSTLLEIWIICLLKFGEASKKVVIV